MNREPEGSQHTASERSEAEERIALLREVRDHVAERQRAAAVKARPPRSRGPLLLAALAVILALSVARVVWVFRQPVPLADRARLEASAGRRSGSARPPWRSTGDFTARSLRRRLRNGAGA